MNHKIKVVEFVTRLEFGGVEAMLLNYLTHFKNPEQFDFHVITQDINDPECVELFEKAGCTVHVVTHKRKSIFKNVKEIFCIMKEEGFDVAHSHMTMTNFYVLFISKILCVPKRISHSHMATNDLGVKVKLVDFILKKMNQIFANVWMACGYDAGTFLFGKRAVDSGRVKIANNAIELKRFSPNEEIRDKIRREYGIKDEFCVGHIGRFMSQKNHQFLIEVFKELLILNPSAKLLLVGDGELRDDVNEQVLSLGLESNVVFTGNIKNTNEVYQAMDVFVLPSLYEGLPVVLIEAQSAGLPCIISDNVDRRGAIATGVEFLSINKSAKEWAQVILEASEKREIYSNNQILIDAGYDIENEAQKLELLYKS